MYSSTENPLCYFMGNFYTKQAPSSEPQKPEADAVKVSVVVPMYCCEDYVEEVLDDLCAQDFKDLEILCVIDGSPDKTLERVEAYAEKDSRIRVFHQEHGGAGTARNHGMAHARGDYLMFLDADDRYTPSFVSKMVRAIEKSGADIATCHYRMENSWTGSSKDNRGFSRNLLTKGDSLHPSQIPDLFCSFSPLAHNKIFRKDFVLLNRLRFSTTDSVNDIFFVLASLVCANKIALVRDTLYTYRAHHNMYSITSNRRLYQQDLYTVYKELYDWLKNRNQTEHYLESFCHRWKNTFHSMARFGVSKDFQKGGVRFLTEQEPWRSMSGRQLYRMAGLGIESAEWNKSVYTKRIKRLMHGTSAYEAIARQIAQRESEIENITEIRKQLESAGVKNLNIRSSLGRAALWRGQDFAAKWGEALLASGKNSIRRFRRKRSIQEN